MSLLTKFVDIVKKGRVRHQHILDLKTWLTGETENTYNAADQTTAKAAVTTAQNGIVDNFQDTTTNLLTNAKTDIGILLNTFKTLYPFASPEDFETAVDNLQTAIDGQIDEVTPNYTQLKTDLGNEVTSGITDTITVNKTDVLESIKDNFIATRDAYQVGGVNYFEYNDPRCKGEGRYPYNQDPNTDQSITTPIHCTSCDGFGKTNIQNDPTVTWPVTETIPET